MVYLYDAITYTGGQMSYAYPPTVNSSSFAAAASPVCLDTLLLSPLVERSIKLRAAFPCKARGSMCGSL